MIKQEIIEQIESSIDIVDVIGEFVSLKKSGSGYRALSPFTNEKTPSFYVVPSKGIFKDFSSGKGGSAITFLMEVEKMTYIDAIKYLAKKYGIDLEETEYSQENIVARNEKESLRVAMKYAVEYYQKTLFETKWGKNIGLTYLRERGYDHEVIKKFNLGFSLPEKNGFVQSALKNGFDENILEKAGLSFKKEKVVLDRFYDRSIFPIQNSSGNTIALAGRTLSNTKKTAKYINSPETKLYTKGKTLYGLYQSKSEIRKKDVCYLVEGYTDVITLHQYGIENVVASSGTTLTLEQIRLLKRFTKNVILLYDGDMPGTTAAWRNIDLLLADDFNTRIIFLPDDKDPDNFVKEIGKQEIKQKLIDLTEDAILYKLKKYKIETDNDPIERAKVTKDLLMTLTKIVDTVTRTFYLQEVSSHLGIDENILIAELNKIQYKVDSRKGHEDVANFITEKNNPSQNVALDLDAIIQNQERESIRILLNYGMDLIENLEGSQLLFDYYFRESNGIKFKNKSYSKIIEHMKESYQDKDFSTKSLLFHPDEEIRKEVIDLLAEKYEISPNWEKKYGIYVGQEKDDLKNITYQNLLRLKYRILGEMIKNRTLQLSEESVEESVSDLLEKIMSLKEIEKDIAKLLGIVIKG